MANFQQMMSMLREQMNATLSRSDVLKPIAWLVGILTTTTAILVWGKAPEWLLIVMAVILVAAILLYGVAYTYCLLHDRDALRSERYSLHKMAIEHGIFGDSVSGVIHQEEQTPKALNAPSAQVSKTAEEQ